MASENHIELYDKLIATQPGIQRKGAANKYTSLNGHMFSFLTKEGPLAIRLPDDEREAFMKRYKTGPVIQYGATMRGYVLVPDTLLAKTKVLKRYFAMSVEYILSLEPKATTKPKKATGKKPAARKPATKKKASTKKASAKKAPSRNVTAKKKTKKTTSRKVTSKKATSKKAVSKKAATKKAGTKKAATKKTGTKKAAARQTAKRKKPATRGR